MLARMPHARFLAFAGVTTATTVLTKTLFGFPEAFVVGFDAGALVFVISTVGLWRNDRAADVRLRAVSDDGGRVLVSTAASMTTIAVMVALGGAIEGPQRLTLTAFAGVTVTLVLAWLVANLVYAFHYAHLYYGNLEEETCGGGIEFPSEATPLFADFVYFSFVLGMTCQTADVNITSRSVRRLATAHGLFAFFFNLGVLSFTVNILASLL